MAQLTTFLKNNKVRKPLLFMILVIFPISVVYAAWLTDSWIFNDMDDEDSRVTSEERDNMEHIEYNLKNVQCPSKEGRKLLDYWECLWRSSITTEGMEQHRRILAENLAYSYDTSSRPFQKPEIRSKREVSRQSKKKRIKRQLYEQPGWSWDKKKMFAHQADSILLFFPSFAIQPFINECQYLELAPDSSIFNFWKCFRDFAATNFTKMDPISKDATFQPSQFPPIENKYDKNQLKLLQLQDIYHPGTTYKLEIEFERLHFEDRVSSFAGADPYLAESWSDFRYRYSNLESKQQQPAWSYRGLHAPNKWHELDNRKFYLPLRKSEKLDGIEFLSDLAQAFPGTGEIASPLKLQAPLDPRWTKDSGYSTYTRFPLPLFTKTDLAYYKSKHLIDPSVKMKSDAAVIQDIIDGLIKFENETREPIAYLHPISFVTVPNPNMVNENRDIPFVQAYREFITHFFKVDLGKYKSFELSKLNRSVLHDEYEIIRSLLRAYTAGVLVQEACTREMVDQYVFRRDGNDLEDLIEKVKNSDPNNPKGACILTPDRNISQKYHRSNFEQSRLKDLYNSYFDRKDARQRYSLPRFPLEFKICSQTDQSPIDIVTTKGRQSSLKDYVFGDAAYRLVRFFMFFPIDASTLLTVGVVNGERQDDSAVRLSGGAVKGQPLSFQYMHIRYANNWKSFGSEHWIDGKGAAMELQMVFTIAGSADEIKYWHVLARVQNQLFQFRGKLVIIISVLVDVIGTDEQLQEKIAQDELNQDPYLFEPLAQAAYHFRDTYANTTERPRGYVSTNPSFRFIDFIPRKSSRFYTYRGSLSWPPCFGYVIWSVYEQRLYMSKRQFDQFAKIPAYGINNNNLANDNFRKQDDIWVDREHDNTLDFATIQSLKRRRTIDRHILVGHHDVTETNETVGLVGEEIYYSDEDSGATNHYCQSLYVILSFTVFLKSFPN